MLNNKYCIKLLKQLGYTCNFDKNGKIISIINKEGHQIDHSSFISKLYKGEVHHFDDPDSWDEMRFDEEDGLDISFYDLPINIKFYATDGFMTFSIVDYSDKNSITFPLETKISFRDNKVPGRSNIVIYVGSCKIMELTQYDIYADVEGYSTNYQKINAEKISTENYVNLIINYLKRFDRSSKWTTGLKEGLRILLPVLTMRVNEFVNTWYKNLDKHYNRAIERQKDLEFQANYTRRAIAQNKMYMEVLEAVKESKANNRRK